MKISFWRFVLMLWILIIPFRIVNAGSFYNSGSLGEIKYFVSAQAIGMGGSLIAVPDQFQINVLNPAALAFVTSTRFSGDFLHEAIWNKTKVYDGFSKYTNLNGISFAIPIKSEKLVTSFNLIPASQSDYEYSESGTINNYSYSKIIKASGGLNKISFGFGWAVTKNIYFGNYLHVNFGTSEKTWIANYVSDLFWDSYDRLTRKMSGLNWTGGLIFRPTANLSVGTIYSGKYKLNYYDEVINTTQKGYIDSLVYQSESPKYKVHIPELWGWGIAYVLKEKYCLSSDFIYQPWIKFKNRSDLLTDYSDSYRFGIGIELLPNKNLMAKYYQKMTYRAGYFFQQLEIKDQSGNKVTEYGISIGVGLPYYGGWGRFDVALRYGQRGDLSSNPVSEDIFQIFVSISGGEKWFIRGK